MVRQCLVLAAFLIPIPGYSHAQVTNCYQYGNQVQCYTNQNAGVNIDTGALNAAQPKYNAIQTQNALAEQQLMLQRIQQQVGQLIAAGRCDDAKKLALRSGNFNLLSAVTSLCH